jgi:hypothetical protein
MCQPLDTFLAVGSLQSVELAFTYAQKPGCLGHSELAGRSLVEYVDPFLLFACQCHLVFVHKVTFSLNY